MIEAGYQNGGNLGTEGNARRRVVLAAGNCGLLRRIHPPSLEGVANRAFCFWRIYRRRDEAFLSCGNCNALIGCKNTFAFAHSGYQERRSGGRRRGKRSINGKTAARVPLGRTTCRILIHPAAEAANRPSPWSPSKRLAFLLRQKHLNEHNVEDRLREVAAVADSAALTRLYRECVE
jgi:hypothetical protein